MTHPSGRTSDPSGTDEQGRGRRLEYWLRRHGDKWNERAGVGRRLAAAGWVGSELLYILRHPVASRSRTRAIARLVAYETHRRRRGAGDVLVELAAGGVLACPADLDCRRAVVLGGLGEFDEQMFASSVVREGDVVLDVGAFVGQYTVNIARRGVYVHAFEPAPRARRVLEENVARNGLGERVSVHGLALSDFSGTSALTTGLGSGNHLVEPNARGAGATTVAVETLDSWATTRDLARLFLVKIDAEGTDSRVIRGAAAVLAASEPVLLVEYWGSGEDVLAALAEHGYDVYRYEAAERALRPARHTTAPVGNFIACTESRLRDIEARLRSHPPVELRPPRIVRGGSASRR